MHCGRSLARVGLDFRGPLAACVARAARGLFHGHIARALAMFCSSLDMHKWTAMPAARVAALQAAPGGGAASAALSDATPLLMQHPPLAVFVNAVRCPPLPCWPLRPAHAYVCMCGQAAVGLCATGAGASDRGGACMQIIVALNAVRSVALASAAGACAADVQAALRDGAAMLVHVPAARELAAPERAVHLAACRCMHETLCPLALTLFEQVRASRPSDAAIACEQPARLTTPSPVHCRVTPGACMTCSRPPLTYACRPAGVWQRRRRPDSRGRRAAPEGLPRRARRRATAAAGRLSHPAPA